MSFELPERGLLIMTSVRDSLARCPYIRLKTNLKNPPDVRRHPCEAAFHVSKQQLLSFSLSPSIFLLPSIRDICTKNNIRNDSASSIAWTGASYCRRAPSDLAEFHEWYDVTFAS
ncbi:hypothetical protein Y032_0069g353 [Ancylostoma ceylanicum]|uniref:Uncharacterized protein n=1 Tax=Ancylostoma ceylanicum TaxID=53326 RepID=A0A016TYM1_9BILA|nr:hypothetical protein Y032_0069g353 [Ancylostoma ceylanicum]